MARIWRDRLRQTTPEILLRVAAGRRKLARLMKRCRLNRETFIYATPAAAVALDLRRNGWENTAKESEE
jgi:hypothetical protein